MEELIDSLTVKLTDATVNAVLVAVKLLKNSAFTQHVLVKMNTFLFTNYSVATEATMSFLRTCLSCNLELLYNTYINNHRFGMLIV